MSLPHGLYPTQKGFGKIVSVKVGDRIRYFKRKKGEPGWLYPATDKEVAAARKKGTL